MDSIIDALKSALGLGGATADPAAQAAAEAELKKKVSGAKGLAIGLGVAVVTLGGVRLYTFFKS